MLHSHAERSNPLERLSAKRARFAEDRANVFRIPGPISEFSGNPGSRREAVHARFRRERGVSHCPGVPVPHVRPFPERARGAPQNVQFP